MRGSASSEHEGTSRMVRKRAGFCPGGVVGIVLVRGMHSSVRLFQRRKIGQGEEKGEEVSKPP